MDLPNCFSIAHLSFSPALVLAPMSGVTSSSFRRLIKLANPKSVGLVVSEFISIEGLSRGNVQSKQMAFFREEERPISVQLYGYDIKRMVDAALMIQDLGVDLLDINACCPVPKVVRRGGGCSLMREPGHLGEMLSALRAVLKIPLTLKIRAGWDDSSKNAVEIARVAEGSGVDCVAIHARTRKAMYSGAVDWALVREICSNVNIPVIGSGNIHDLQSAKDALQLGVAAIMIGRGALANPWIFSDLVQSREHAQLVCRSLKDKVELLLKYAELLAEDFPAKAIIGRLKQLASQMIRDLPGSVQLRRELCYSASLSEFKSILEREHKVYLC